MHPTKQNYRSRVPGFWGRSLEKNSGRYGSLWITEENS